MKKLNIDNITALTEILTKLLDAKPKQIYECKFDGCNKAYLTSTALLKHAKVHKRAKPHKCPI